MRGAPAPGRRRGTARRSACGHAAYVDPARRRARSHGVSAPSTRSGTICPSVSCRGVGEPCGRFDRRGLRAAELTHLGMAGGRAAMRRARLWPCSRSRRTGQAAADGAERARCSAPRCRPGTGRVVALPPAKDPLRQVDGRFERLARDGVGLRRLDALLERRARLPGPPVRRLRRRQRAGRPAPERAGPAGGGGARDLPASSPALQYVPGEFGVPTPGYDLKTNYGDLELVEHADLSELRVGADRGALWLLARTTTMTDPGKTALLVLLDTAPGVAGARRAVRRPASAARAPSTPAAVRHARLGGGPGDRRGARAARRLGRHRSRRLRQRARGARPARRCSDRCRALRAGGRDGHGRRRRPRAPRRHRARRQRRQRRLPRRRAGAQLVGQAPGLLALRADDRSLLRRGRPGEAHAAAATSATCRGPATTTGSSPRTSGSRTEKGLEGTLQHYGVYIPSAYDERRTTRRSSGGSTSAAAPRTSRRRRCRASSRTWARTATRSSCRRAGAVRRPGTSARVRSTSARSGRTCTARSRSTAAASTSAATRWAAGPPT